MTILVRIMGMTLRHKWRLGAAYACTVGATAAYLYLPRLFGRAIDEVATAFSQGDAAESAVLGTILLILGISVIRGVLSYGQTYLGESLSQVVAYDLRNAFYDRVQHLSFAFHDRHHTGNLMSRAIVDVENLRMFINMGLVRTPYFVALFVITAAVLLTLDWPLGLMSISFMPLVAIQSGLVRLKMRRIWLRVSELMAEMNAVLQENLTGIRVVKAFAAESHEERKFDVRSREVMTQSVAAERMRISNTTFMLFIFLVAIGLILWYGGSRVIDGRLTPGELAQFIFYMQILAMPVRMAGWLVNSFARATSSGERIFEVLDHPSPVEDRAGAVEMPRVRGHVHLDGVSFGYEGGPPVLRGIDLDAQPGEVVALLGTPGSGKTTIVNLLPRFYDVTSGRVTVDGMDVRDVTLASLRRNIGMVQQDVFLFTASIRDNIAYGRRDASTEEVVAAARVAQLHDFIETLDRGYDTVLGERGATLSGGQRQRLAIARAVLLDPPILILDDSTSSVDAATEEAIRRAMEAVMQGRTTFVIAHRLTTVYRADQIVVLRDGEVAERGTHRTLLGMGGLYREIFELQLRPQEERMLDVDLAEQATRRPLP